MSENLHKERVAKIWNILVDCADKKQKINYTDISKILSLNAPIAIGNYLRDIQTLCRNKYPPLSILAIKKNGNIPGSGFNASDNIEESTKEVFDFDWHRIPNPFLDINVSIFDLSKENFITVLKKDSIFHNNDIPLLKCFFEESDYTQSALELAYKLGYSDIGPVNAIIGKFAKRIAEYYGVNLEREGNSPGWWRIIADGKEENGVFYWTLKQTLISAIIELNLLKKACTYWLLPCNKQNYDVEKAYLKYHTIDWHQTNSKIEINDIVYIYESKPYQRIRFSCVVIAINKKFANKKDRDCYIDSTPYENKDCYMTLKFLRRFEYVFPNMDNLTKNDVHVVRTLLKVPNSALQYIKECEQKDLLRQSLDRNKPRDITKKHWSFTGTDEEELQEQTKKDAQSLSDVDLFEKAKQRSSLKPKEYATTTSTYVRDQYVAEASKRRANGICQLCEKPAPFKDKNGKPYLESHHIIWLSKGGSDTLENTVALCPNCHKKMHIVNDQNDVIKLQELLK